MDITNEAIQIHHQHEKVNPCRVKDAGLQWARWKAISTRIIYNQYYQVPEKVAPDKQHLRKLAINLSRFSSHQMAIWNDRSWGLISNPKF